MNFNPGAGDAFFTSTGASRIDTQMFNGGYRPTLDAVQTEAGNYPAFRANNNFEQRKGLPETTLAPKHHSQIYVGENNSLEARAAAGAGVSTLDNGFREIPEFTGKNKGTNGTI